MLRKIFQLALFPFAITLAACGDDDNPVNTDADGDTHADAFGVQIISSGQELARYASGRVSGEIEVGHEKETALLTVRFIGEDGDIVTPDADDGFSLSWEIADETIAEVEQHAEDGAWSFHIVGVANGQTSIVIKLNHNGHTDFVSLEIPIHVEEDGPGEAHHEEHGEEHGEEHHEEHDE